MCAGAETRKLEAMSRFLDTMMEDTLEEVQAVVQTVLDAIDHTPLVFGHSLLEDLVDGQINDPEPKPCQNKPHSLHPLLSNLE